MPGMPRVRLILVVTALLALLIVPMAGARTAGSASVRPADSDWIGGIVSWAQNLVGLRQTDHHGRSGPQSSLTQKETTTTNVVQGGGCISPDGRPRPCY